MHTQRSRWQLQPPRPPHTRPICSARSASTAPPVTSQRLAPPNRPLPRPHSSAAAAASAPSRQLHKKPRAAAAGCGGGERLLAFPRRRTGHRVEADVEGLPRRRHLELRAAKEARAATRGRVVARPWRRLCGHVRPWCRGAAGPRWSGAVGVTCRGGGGCGSRQAD